MAIVPPPGIVRGKGVFNVRTFRAVSVALNNQQRELDELFEEAASGDTTGAAVQDLTALRAIAGADRTDKQLRLVEDAPGGTGLGAIYRFDATGVGSDDGDLIIVPAAGSGRWFKTSNVEGGFFKAGAGTDAAIGKGATPPTAAGDNAFAHGNFVAAAGDHSFAQGTANNASGYSSFAQGDSNNAGGNQGFAQGSENSASGNYGSFAQGSLNTASQYYTFAQGKDNTASGAAGFAQGYDNTAGAGGTFAQGYSNTVSGIGSFAQGKSNIINSGAKYSFAQGYANTVAAAALRGFAQGAFAHAKFADAKMWGTNRAVLGKAQSGKVGKHLNTTDATADQVVASIPLVASSIMLLEAAIVGRGPNTKVLWTDRILIRVFRDSSGDAVINGAPSFTATLAGFTTAAVAAPAVNGGAIELKVTGEAATVIDWTAELKIIECVT